MTETLTVLPTYFRIGAGATEAEITGSGFTTQLKAAVLMPGCTVESYEADKKSKKSEDEDDDVPIDDDIPIEQPPLDYITDTSFPFSLTAPDDADERERILVLINGDEIFGSATIWFVHQLPT